MRLARQTLHAVSLLCTLGSLACGSSNSSPSDGGDASSPSDGATNEAGDSDATMDSGASTPTCTAYCTTIMTNCTGAQAQYGSADTCNAVCPSFPVGTSADTTGDTLGCRIYHAGAAGGDPVTHCNHAGLTGGDLDPSDSTGPVCGEGCEAFCNEALRACTGAQAVYANNDACMAECRTFPAASTTFSTADTSGDTFNCRVYHLTAAATDPVTHCPHIVKASPVCK